MQTKSCSTVAIRQQSLAGLAPQVEGLSQLEKDAKTAAQQVLDRFNHS